MNAPRALPTCSGPVGLADTNSTLTGARRAGATRPQRVGLGEDAPRPSARGRRRRRRRLRKPGGATSARDDRGGRIAGRPRRSIARRRAPWRSPAAPSGTGARASSRGWSRGRRASGSAGRSTSIATGGLSGGRAGRAPPAMAASHARPISSLAVARIEEDSGCGRSVGHGANGSRATRCGARSRPTGTEVPVGGGPSVRRCTGT